MVAGSPTPSPNTLVSVSNAIVKMHKELLGRGPTHVRAEFAGADALVCVLEDALLPAERALVEIGEHERVREIRTILQEGTRQRFVNTVEELTGRKVRAFSSTIDPQAGVVFEVFAFEPAGRLADAGASA
jgi:uncharacterized protein YbcI